MKHIVGISAAIVMACSLSAQADEKVPAPNEKNCSGSTYDQILASLSKDSDRNEFVSTARVLTKLENTQSGSSRRAHRTISDR